MNGNMKLVSYIAGGVLIVLFILAMGIRIGSDSADNNSSPQESSQNPQVNNIPPHNEQGASNANPGGYDYSKTQNAIYDSRNKNTNYYKLRNDITINQEKEMNLAKRKVLLKESENLVVKGLFHETPEELSPENYISDGVDQRKPNFDPRFIKVESIRLLHYEMIASYQVKSKVTPENIVKQVLYAFIDGQIVSGDYEGLPNTDLFIIELIDSRKHMTSYGPAPNHLTITAAVKSYDKKVVIYTRTTETFIP